MDRRSRPPRQLAALALAAVAAVLLGGVLGAALIGPGGSPPAVGIAPTPTATATRPDPTAAATASPIAVPPDRDHIWVYFARDQLPPYGTFIGGIFNADRAESRILSRIEELHRASASEVPAGATNPIALLGTTQQTSQGSQGSLEMSVRVEGDLATVEFGPGHFDRIHGSAMIGAILGQLVYTITEEPGIRRALLAERGKRELVIDNMAVIRDPLTREDVLPYKAYGNVRTEQRIALEDDPRPSTVTTRIEDLTGGIRFVIEMKANEIPPEGFWSPRFIADLRANDLTSWNPETFNSTGDGLERAKWILRLVIGGARASSEGYRTVAVGQRGAPVEGKVLQNVERTPLRFVLLTHKGGADAGAAYELGLDDARPWRVSLEPGQPGTMRLLVDIGGHPQAVSDSIAVYEPRPGTDSSVVGRTFTIRGAARAFEAHVSWRLKDASQREVARGFATASLGTSPVWGTFTTEVKVPDTVGGGVTLEVFWPSPRDGADVGLVRIPLRVR